MANFGLGLAQGFQLGTQIGDALRQKRMREAFEEAQADKQFKKYTPAQGEQMRREAAMVDEFGNPVYEFSIEPGSTTYTRREVRYPRTPEPAPVSLANIEEPEPRSLGTMYRVPVGEAAYTPDTTGETIYEPNRELAPRPRGLSVSNLPEYSPALLPPEVSRVQQRLGREYGDSTMYSPEATQYLGQTYGAEGLTPTQQRAALMNRYADIISKYESPVEGERFRSMARAEERAEETFGLTKEMTEIARDKARREEKEAGEIEQLSKEAMDYRRANPSATPRDIVNHLMFAVKASPAALTKYVASVAQVDAAELQLMNSNIDRKIRGKSLAGMIKLYNDDDMFDPNTKMVEEKGPKGEVVLKVVDSKDPSKVLETFSFKDPTTARDFLINSAKNPGQQAQWLRTMQLQEDQGIYFRARAERSAAGRGTGRDYTNVERIQEINGLVRHRDSAAREADRLREDVNNMRPNDRNYAQTVARYNAADALVQQLDRQIQDLRGGGGGLTRGGGAAPKRYSIGDIEEATTTDGKKVKVKLVRGDGSREEDWEVLAPSSTKAEPKAEAEVKTAPAKEEPPKKDTTKYIREKSPRGTYTYTESPRGLTREQWAQLDEEKKRK